MASNRYNILHPEETGYKNLIEDLSNIFKELGLQAFATGSRIRGTERVESDFDIIVVKDSKAENRKETIEKNLNNKINSDVYISVRIHSLSDIKSRIQRGDPLILTLFDGFVNLSLDSKTLNNIKTLYPQSPPKSMFNIINDVKKKNVSTAAATLSNAIIYEGYNRLARSGQLPVPPEQLPDKLENTDKSFSEAVSCAVKLRQLARDQPQENGEIMKQMRILLTEINNDSF